MHLRLFCFLYVLMLYGAVQSFAQQAGPRTLEGLLNSGDAQKPAAAAKADATDAGPSRPAGTVARPETGVKHPTLDRAWADYDAAVGEATESIKAALNSRFDAAAAKGDLDTAVKWQMALERFAQSGRPLAKSEMESDVKIAIKDFEKAFGELTKAYDAVVKSLTMEKKIAEAKAVQAESEAVQAAITLDKKESKAKKAPSMRGVWIISNGANIVIKQRDNTIAWAFQSHAGYKHQIICEWDGEHFIGVCQRTSPGSGCVTRLRVVVTPLAENHIKIDNTALDANCDLHKGYAESCEGVKR